MQNKPVLAFDCACFGASVSLRSANGIRTLTLPLRNQAAGLIPAMQSLLAEASLSYGDLGTIVTTIGPGSFTGLRVGLAALHGLVLVNHTPLKTLTTLEAMAWHLATQKGCPPRVTVAIRAGKGELYVQDFELRENKPTALSEITFAPENKQDWELPCFGNHLPEGDAHYLAGPNTETLCLQAEQFTTATLADAMPLYIRPPDAIIPAQLPWLATSGHIF